MSTLRDISELLARIEAPGAFATRRTTSADDLHLEVKGVGRIRWPISRMTARTTIALDPEDDRLLSRAARERGVSRSEFVRQHLALVLEQYRRHPKPRSAGIVRGLTERGDERELFAGGR
jgi:hypothetical protein